MFTSSCPRVVARVHRLVRGEHSFRVEPSQDGTRCQAILQDGIGTRPDFKRRFDVQQFCNAERVPAVPGASLGKGGCEGFVAP